LLEPLPPKITVALDAAVKVVVPEVLGIPPVVRVLQ